MKPRIYNRSMELVGVLQNASSVGYLRTHNDLFTASFELPFDDPKNMLCDTHFIVDIFDGETSKGKYRILDEPETDLTTAGQFARYSCEHVIAFLLNDVIDGYLELGGTGITTRAVIERLLSMQTVRRWQLGTCDFDYQFQYSWENTNLLDALFSIPSCFVDDYHWTYDTDSYPWTINLVRQDKDRSCEIRRKRNMQYIKREKDVSSGFYTRLYCKGSGEGVNQLNIRQVNGGLPYIDADTISTYGVICGHYIDLTITDAETLLAKGRAVLEEVKHPRYTYKAKAVDLCKVTGLDWHSFDEGKYVHIVDEEKKINLDAMIIEVSKSDVDGDPLDIDLTISNKPSDASSAIEDLSKRAAITAQYSQGATNLYSQQYSDNADAEHPATMRVYIPSECKQINKMLLSWELSSFRAYETGASAGGSTIVTSGDGGATTVTSGGGGATTVTSSDGGATSVTSGGGGATTVTSDDGGATTVTSSDGGATTITSGGGGGQTVTSSGGGAKTYTSSSGGGETYSSSEGGSTEVTSSAGGASETTSGSGGGTAITTEQTAVTTAMASGPALATGGSYMSETGSSSPATDSKGYHTHSFDGAYTLHWGHTHLLGDSTSNTGGVVSYAAKRVEISGTTGGEGSHTHTVESHTHFMGHYHEGAAEITIPPLSVTIPWHTHSITIDDHSHEVNIPPHMHSVTVADHMHEVKTLDHMHDVTLYDHTHSVKTPDHTHSITLRNHSHSISLGNHTHSVQTRDHTHNVTIGDHSHSVQVYDHTHTVGIGSHTHDIVYGIYEGSTAQSVSVVVDGNAIPSASFENGQVDIVEYLAKDNNGKITRGTWHTIQLVPDTLTRIEANLFVQTFIQSIGGGNY